MPPGPNLIRQRLDLDWAGKWQVSLLPVLLGLMGICPSALGKGGGFLSLWEGLCFCPPGQVGVGVGLYFCVSPMVVRSPLSVLQGLCMCSFGLHVCICWSLGHRVLCDCPCKRKRAIYPPWSGSLHIYP